MKKTYYRKGIFFLSLFLFVTPLFAWHWIDLWKTPDQQGQVSMQKEDYGAASKQFQRPDWQATAAYRAGDFDNAARQFSALQTEPGFYNAGNALARQGKLEQAVQAYDKALQLNPHDQDAIYNRKQVLDRLKQQQQQQQQQQDKQSQQQSIAPDQSSQHKPQQNDSAKQSDASKLEKQAGSNQENKRQEKPGSSQDKSAQQDANLPEHDKSPQDETKPSQSGKTASSEQQENEDAKQQWLRLIPDDPGGLLRQKFLRDYYRAQQRN